MAFGMIPREGNMEQCRYKDKDKKYGMARRSPVHAGRKRQGGEPENAPPSWDLTPSAFRQREWSTIQRKVTGECGRDE